MAKVARFGTAPAPRSSGRATFWLGLVLLVFGLGFVLLAAQSTLGLLRGLGRLPALSDRIDSSRSVAAQTAEAERAFEAAFQNASFGPTATPPAALAEDEPTALPPPADPLPESRFGAEPEPASALGAGGAPAEPEPGDEPQGGAAGSEDEPEDEPGPEDLATVACGPVTCDEGLVCCNESCGICTPPGESCSKQACGMPYLLASVSCGPNTCNVGQVCCNPSCGTCTAPDASCDTTPCENRIQYPGASQMCGMQTCNAGYVCCNPSCGICKRPGEPCSHEVCG